jgi:hypothetical protein
MIYLFQFQRCNRFNLVAKIIVFSGRDYPSFFRKFTPIPYTEPV